jgi:hypothetical protein
MLSCRNYKKKAIEVGGVFVCWIEIVDITIEKVNTTRVANGLS